MLDKKPATIGSMFDRIAPTYDRLNRVLSLNTDQIWRKRAVKSLAIRKGDCVLDIATGTGDLAMLALSCAPCSIVGIDLSREMISIAARKCSSRGFADRALFINGDGLSVPLGTGTIHRAMIAFGIRNMTDVGGFLNELHRVLVAGGRVVILEFSLPDNMVLRKLYLTYFERVLPYIGGRLSGDKNAYRYLIESVLDFPSPRELSSFMNRRGFEVISSRRLFLGIVHLFVLRKRGDSA